MKIDLPEPVVPQTNMCGKSSKSAQTKSPLIFKPKGTYILPYFPSSNLRIHSLKLTKLDLTLAISKPDVDLPLTIGTNLQSKPPSLTEMSLTYFPKPLIDTFFSVAISYCVTKGPIVYETILAPMPKSLKTVLIFSCLALATLIFSSFPALSSRVSSKSIEGYSYGPTCFGAVT
jgi:hypothetical protein